jgi:hypothetical protein
MDIGSLILGRELPIKIRDIVEAIDTEKDKAFRPNLKEEERKKEIKKLDLDYFDKSYNSANKMHFNVPGIGFLGSPFS